MFYSSFGDRQNTTYLKSNKFIKLLSDAQIIPNCIMILHINRNRSLGCRYIVPSANQTHLDFDIISILINTT